MKIWVNGCFDVLHYGHFCLLRHAVRLGDRVVVGIDSDRRVSLSKGYHRPYHTVSERIFNLKSIKGIDKVIVFDSDDELRWHIENEEPDAMVIGSDYKGEEIIGSEFIPRIEYFERVNKYSTTNILKDE